jgi:hypothetical protein
MLWALTSSMRSRPNDPRHRVERLVEKGIDPGDLGRPGIDHGLRPGPTWGHRSIEGS